MSTVNLVVDEDDGWTLAASSGNVDLSASKSIEYCTSDGVPDESLLGHHLKTMDTKYIKLSDVELYVRGDDENVIVVVTSGL